MVTMPPTIKAETPIVTAIGNQIEIAGDIRVP
jgi:hypothetical protein